MKKYNTPEMKVSMFDSESITAAEVSTTLATYDYYVNNTAGVKTFEKSWKDIEVNF